MKKVPVCRLLVLTIGFLLLSAPVEAINNSWSASAETARTLENSNRPVEASRYEIAAMQDLLKGRPEPSDAALRRFMFHDVSNTIQSLALQKKTHSDAVALAQWKRAVAQSALKADASFYLDATFDLMLAQISAGGREAGNRTQQELNAGLLELSAKNPAACRELQAQFDRKLQRYQSLVQMQAMTVLNSSAATIRRALGR